MSKENIQPPRVVIGIVQNAGGRFLVIERAGDAGPLRYAFPGGKVESGETDTAAVIREVREETGVTCRVTRKLGERLHPDTGRIIAYYLCTTDAVTATPHAREAVSARFYSGPDTLSLFTTDIYAPVQALLQASAAKPIRTPAP